jgi:hypothetical protein
MLRNLVIGVGFICFLAGLVAMATGFFPPAAVFAFWGAMIVLGTVCERVVYKRIELARPGPGWQRTTERFVDDQTGKPVTVYIEPKSGERAYVQD